MIGRHVAIPLGLLLLIASCSRSFAATPPALAELEVEHAIAEADQDRSSAEYELAAWRLAELRELNRRGHASWQEVAEQEVAAKAAAASAEAAKQYLQVVLNWQSRVAKINAHSEQDSETIKLYLPLTARLVAWIPTEAATEALSRQQLELLRSEHRSLSAIDLSPREAAIKQARRAVDVYGRSQEDATLARRAEIRLRLAKSEYQLAKARKESADLIANRIESVSKALKQRQSADEEPSFSLAQTGTRFVDGTCDDELAQLVQTMATDQSTTSGQVAWLQHQRTASLNRIDALKSLSASAAADPGELEHAQQQAADLQLQIARVQDALLVQQETASRYEGSLNRQPTDVREQPSDVREQESDVREQAKSTVRDFDDDFVASAAAVRHVLELQQLQLKTVADRASIQAQFDYLTERARRVERIPEQARPPQELENLRHQVQGLQLQLAMIDRERQLLDHERQRFCLQLESQQGDQYQFVQAPNGTFISRVQFEHAQELLGMIGFVGDPAPLRLPTTYSYIESPTLFDCLNRLSFQSSSAPANHRNRTGYRSRFCLTPIARPNIWEAPLAANGVQWAQPGISYPWDRCCYTPYGLRRTRLDNRSVLDDYLRTSVTHGYRSYYPYGSYAFGLSRPSQFSLQSRMPPINSFPDRSSYLDRSSWPRRTSPYTDSFRRLIDCY